MTKQQLTKTAAALLAASLVFGNTAAWAETSPAAATSAAAAGATGAAATVSGVKRFPDVAATHWASKHIAKLALLGIVEGNEKGQYQPEAKVTQEQVITMAIRMMGLEADAKALPAFYSELEVSEYAKPYLHMALEKGLIDWQEEKTLSGTAKWGAKDATREWVAKLTVRAIGKKEDALKLGAKDTAFTDNAAISVWARGYINEAVDLKIVNGMDDGSFKPQDYVTRAQMATFFSRGGQYASETNSLVKVGIVESATEQSISIVDDWGQKGTYNTAADTVYYGLAGDSPIRAADLKPENKVYLILAGDKAVYAEVLEEKAAVSDSLEGTLVKLDLQDASAKLTVKTAGGDAVAELAVPPTILDADGKGLKLSDLVEGAVLELKRTGSRAKFSTVIVKHIPVNKTGEGVIQSIDLNERKLNVLEKESGTVQYPMAETVTYLNGGAAGDLSTLRSRDTISYRVTNDMVTHIDMVTPYVEPSDSGKLVDYKSDKNVSYITIQKPDNQYATYAIESQVDIVIPGMEYTSPKDLAVGDQVKVMLTDNNGVYRINVSNRSMQTDYLNTVVSFDPDLKLLTVKNMDGAPRVYELSDGTRYNLNGNIITLSTAQGYLTKGKKLDITASSDTNVKEVRVVSGYEGTVARADADRSELTLKIGEKLLTLKVYSGASIELTNRSGAKLSELPVGAKVNTVYETSLDGVVRVQVVDTALYRLAERNTTANQVTLKNEAGATLTFAVSSTTKLYNQAQAPISLSELVLDEPYFVSLIGNTLDKMVVAAANRGTITEIDPTGGKVSLSESGSLYPRTLNIGTDAKIKREGSAGNLALSDLKAGDRVEIVKDPYGVYYVTVAQTIQKKVDYYDPASQNLFVLREYLSEKRNYGFHSKAYLHKGSNALTLTGLAKDDTVLLYVVDGRIIELDQQ